MNLADTAFIRLASGGCLAALQFWCAIAQPQTVFDLDKNLEFQLRPDRGTYPAFAPETNGLTTSMLGFDQAFGSYSSVANAVAEFPPMSGDFIAPCVEPSCSLLPNPICVTAELDLGGPLSLVFAFDPPFSFPGTDWASGAVLDCRPNYALALRHAEQTVNSGGSLHGQSAAGELEAASLPLQVPVWKYTLLTSSRLVDSCPICDRIPIVAPLQGRFAMRLVGHDPLFFNYAVEDIELFAYTPEGRAYKVHGRGVYKVGGELALRQGMTLEVWIDNGSSSSLCILTNSTPEIKRGWPIIQVTLDQANGTPTQQYQIELVAAPVRQIFFSTVHGFTPGISPSPAEHVGRGDLVSDAGNIVALNRELIAKLGLMPSPDPLDLGLDAVDILPGSEIIFSVETGVFSEILGYIHHGDMLSNSGRVLMLYTDLIAPFVPMPPLPDVGLDAFQVVGSGEAYFSVEADFFSEKLGVLVRRGDLLSSKGLIVKTQAQLLSQFHPPAERDVGLDAIYVWPSGELWFSVEESFEDDILGWINHGDLLSDRGEVLYRNLDLLRNFQPLEDLADFGLDGIYIVSDAVFAPTNTTRCVEIRAGKEDGGVILRWETSGRVRQLEKASAVLGPWEPVGPVTTDVVFIDTNAPVGLTQAFYRLREW